MLKGLFFAMAALALVSLAGPSAQAMPVAPGKSAVSSSSDTVLVAGGCGRGWHRGPYGGCRRN